MNLHSLNYGWRSKPSDPNLGNCRNFIGRYNSMFLVTSKLSSGYRANFRAFACQNPVKKRQKNENPRKPNKPVPIECDGIDENSAPEENNASSSDNLEIQQASIAIPSREAVLKACTVTSCSLAALGIVIRQVSHIASVQGWAISDCSTEISFHFEMWHLQLITELVVVISSCRYLLLKTWPNFAKSSEAANRQILTSLQPIDYMVVAFLPGFGEEILFRGAFLPLLGINWKSIVAVAALFGVLHLGNGRKYSFAAWATFVGLVYGYAAIASSSIIVPMVSHAVNNLVGGIIWRSSSNPSK